MSRRSEHTSKAMGWLSLDISIASLQINCCCAAIAFIIDFRYVLPSWVVLQLGSEKRKARSNDSTLRFGIGGAGPGRVVLLVCNSDAKRGCKPEDKARSLIVRSIVYKPVIHSSVYIHVHFSPSHKTLGIFLFIVLL